MPWGLAGIDLIPLFLIATTSSTTNSIKDKLVLRRSLVLKFLSQRYELILKIEIDLFLSFLMLSIDCRPA